MNRWMVGRVALIALLVAACAMQCGAAQSAKPMLFPRPKEITWASGAPLAVPSGAVAIVVGNKATEPEQYAGEALARYVKKRFGVQWPIVREGAKLSGYKTLVVLGQRGTCQMLDRLCREWKVKLTADSPGWDGYVVRVGKDAGRTVAIVGGSNPRGVVYGQDTLFQMLRKAGDKLVLYPASIRDWPSIKWRGRPHSSIVGYERQNTFDAFAQARVNWIDLRWGGGIYGSPPGVELPKDKLRDVVKEAHRRGFFIFATVDCAVPKSKYDGVIKTYEEFLSLGADGIYISIDDPGGDTRAGTSIELLKRVVELGKKHGITGDKLAMVPGKESYMRIDTATNYKVGHTPGLEKVLLFQTTPPSMENLKKTLACGFKTPPAWWLNWPRSRGGFTHIGNANKRVDGGMPYMDLPQLYEGWWVPQWEDIKDAGKTCVAVMPWGGSIWGAEYVAHVLNLWAWNPEGHVWSEERRRIYDICYGPDMVGTVTQFEDQHRALRDMFVVAPDYPGNGISDGAYQWPPCLRNLSDRPKALTMLDEMAKELDKIDAGAPKGSLLATDELVKCHLEPMRKSIEVARVMTTLDYPEYWWKNHEQRVLLAVKAGNLEQAGKWEQEARARALKESAYVVEALKPLVGLDDYDKLWVNRFKPVAEARYCDRPIQMKGDLSDPMWAQAPKLGPFGYGDALPHDPGEAQVLYTDDAIYVGITCYESSIGELLLDRTARDSDVWENDSVEIFLNPDGLLRPAYQFVANANGVQFDCSDLPGQPLDRNWNAEWEVKTALAADRWTAEIRVPFSSIGVTGSQKGHIWMCNFARNDRSTPDWKERGYRSCETSCYGAWPDGGLHDTRRLRPVNFK